MDALTNRLLKSISAKQWENVGVRPHHGINLPLSALHSEKSAGSGEFFDLLPIIDWCSDLKLDFIQLLPLNNTDSASDPSPYNALSSCAINPLYLSLHALPLLEKLSKLKRKLSKLSKFNETNKIAYSDVFSHKLSWLNEYYNEVGSEILKTDEFKKFQSENPWVKPYALFKTLKNHLNNTSWTTWPEDLRYPTPERLLNLYEIYEERMSFYLLLQFLCYIQLIRVKEYAQKKGVFLMGDIPILLSIESCDVWLHLELFDSQLSAGSPPDAYNKEGQNWGLPIFNWDMFRKNHFEWWKQRLHYAENFFDICRLDHVIGFFRIWAIPPNHPSKEGRFIPENEKQWEPQGREILTMIATSTKMLLIGEDLGIVPDVVPLCLNDLGICGTKVMRWERKWEKDKSFIRIQDYPPVSITCVSTHDSESLTLWWKNFSDESKALAESRHWIWSPDLSDNQRQEILWDSHHSASLFHVNLLQEYLAFFPDLSWPNPEDERINIPGKILSTNWAYRFRPSVEKIIAHKELSLMIKKIIS